MLIAGVSAVFASSPSLVRVTEGGETDPVVLLLIVAVVNM